MESDRITEEHFKQNFLNLFRKQKIVFKNDHGKILEFNLEGLEEPEYHEKIKMTLSDLSKAKYDLRFRANNWFGNDHLYLFVNFNQTGYSIGNYDQEKIKEELGNEFKLTKNSENLLKKIFNYQSEFLISTKN